MKFHDGLLSQYEDLKYDALIVIPDHVLQLGHTLLSPVLLLYYYRLYSSINSIHLLLPELLAQLLYNHYCTII